MFPEQRDALRRILQAETELRRVGEQPQKFHLLHSGGMTSEVDHPAWDASWATPSELTIDDLEELGLLRVDPSTSRARSFVLTPRGRAEAEALVEQTSMPRTPPGRAPAADVVLQWLAETEKEAPECFDLPVRLLDRAVQGGFIGMDSREPFASRMLSLIQDGYLSGQVFDLDQATSEQVLVQAADLHITIKGHGAARRIVPLRGEAPPRHFVPADTSDEIRDVFISHASEDKSAIARPLAEALRGRGFSVWFDEYELLVGDRLSEKIDNGLATSRCGVVILSQAFFAKPWTQRELSGLVAREVGGNETIILPVWHGITSSDVRQFSPPLADVLAIDSRKGLDAVIEALSPAVKRRRGQESLAGRPLAADETRPAPASGSRGGLADEELFRFDVDVLADFSIPRAHRALERHGDIYRSQLIMARWLDGWRERMDENEWYDRTPAEAFDYAVRELAAHLRQGDFLPDGVFYRDEMGGNPGRG